MAENLEQKYYNSIYTKTDPTGSGRIEGRQAVALFRTSGVPVPTLKTIWELATPNKEDYLDKNRFFIALKLIALAQEGKPVSLQVIHEKVGLPKFEGIELPAPSDDWEVGENESTVYLNGFKKLSGDKGFLTQAESKELLQRTQFPPEVLKRIWLLIGLGSGNMNADQFVVAMQLIAKARGGVEVPEVLPQSLDKILNKKVVKEEVKKPEMRLKDPESHVDVPRPVAQATLGDDYESPKKPQTVTVKIDTEKFIREKEKILKEKTNMLKSICELILVDEAELELVKEKNKILEEKIKESHDNFEKIKKKVAKAKEKFESVLVETNNELEKLKKENINLKNRPVEIREVKPAEVPKPEPAKVPQRPSEEYKMPKKDIGFEFDNFFKDPLPSKPKEEEKPQAAIPKPDLFQSPPVPSMPPVPTVPTVSTTPSVPSLSSIPDSNLFPVERTSEKIELKKPEPAKTNLFPEFSMNFEGFNQPKPRKDDVFASIEPNPPAKEKPKMKSSSSDEEVKPSAEFQFRFSEDLEKKVEKNVELKPEPLGFNAGFGDFGKGFNFAGSTPSFDDNFFKMDVKPVQNKAKRDLEFD